MSTPTSQAISALQRAKLEKIWEAQQPAKEREAGIQTLRHLSHTASSFTLPNDAPQGIDFWKEWGKSIRELVSELVAQGYLDWLQKQAAATLGLFEEFESRDNPHAEQILSWRASQAALFALLLEIPTLTDEQLGEMLRKSREEDGRDYRWQIWHAYEKLWSPHVKR